MDGRTNGQLPVTDQLDEEKKLVFVKALNKVNRHIKR